MTRPNNGSPYQAAGQQPPAPGRRNTGATGATGGAGGASGRRGGKRPRPRWQRVLLVVGAVAAILVGAGVITAVTLMNRVSGNVGRIEDAFAGLDESKRPTKPEATKDSQTFLLLGSDSRDTEQTTGSAAKGKAWVPGAQRTDTIMLVHIPANHGSAQVISIPRDSWVDIPGKGKNKINAAYSLGGPSLLIQTVENLTQVRIDHFAIVDFAGFKSIIDSIGGVDVEIAEDTVDLEGNRFHKGINHLDGTTALGYVRQRHGLAAGDFDRVKRQQNLIRSVMTKLSTFNPASDPVGAYRLIDSMTKSISVDDQLSNSQMRALAFDVPQIRGGGTTFLTAPVRGTGMEGTQSVVYLNADQAPELWNAVRNDNVAAYASTHSKDLLPAVPR
ncbi:LCP family protein [Planosporangium sp. 12N6]|uniref:LCP family protein n=1 Tax=Planosporangium spinosum TaxID=3402278 RepID=UPI003CEB4385